MPALAGSERKAGTAVEMRSQRDCVWPGSTVVIEPELSIMKKSATGRCSPPMAVATQAASALMPLLPPPEPPETMTLEPPLPAPPPMVTPPPRPPVFVVPIPEPALPLAPFVSIVPPPQPNPMTQSPTVRNVLGMLMAPSFQLESPDRIAKIDRKADKCNDQSGPQKSGTGLPAF